MISGQDYLSSMDPNDPNDFTGPNGPNGPNSNKGHKGHKGRNDPNDHNGPNGPNSKMGSYYVLPPDHPSLPSISSFRAMQLLSASETPAKVGAEAGIARSCRCSVSCT